MKSEGQLLPVDQPVPPVWGGQAETSLLDFVVFSKDRPAQLDALLRSVRAFLPCPHRLHVLYTTTTAEFEAGYDRLRRWHRGVYWRPDENQFRGAFLALMKTIRSGPGRYLMFGVDDMLFTRPFTAMNLVRSLDEDEAILAVSLRMGENIRYCYPRDRDTRPPDFRDGYRWAWKEASPGYWNYPMSLDGHVFRTSDLAALIPTLNFTGPNSLESALSGHPLPRPDLVCEAIPTVLNVAANRVQEQFAGRCGSQSARSLNRSFLDGQAIDVRPFTSERFNACHIEQDLPLMADEREPEPAGWERIEREGRAYLRIDLREIPTFILNCADDGQKRLLMVEQMAELGLNYEFIPTLRVAPGWVGVALGHLKVLRLSRARPPFLVLEDDCVFGENFRPVIEVPEQADCLYLGASIFGLQEPGRMSWGRAGEVQWERFDADYLRVYNMLARHALLYLKPGFQQAVIESQVEALTNRHLPHMGDIGLAMLQPDYTALLTARSMCRQLDRDATVGDLADLLPGNERVDGKAVAPGQGLAHQPTARSRLPRGSCLISHKYRFIYFQIGKNASSTLKAALREPRYECEQVPIGSVDDATLDAYFTFTFLRDPVSRLVSAYQEISMRHEMKDSAIGARPFLEMDDGPERFEAFLDEIEKDKWDKHVVTQSELLGALPVDFHGRVETLATDLQKVFDTLDLGPCPDLPRLRSRSVRKAAFGYDRFHLDHHALTPEQVARIRRLYQEDVDRVEAHCPAPALFTGGSRGGPSSQSLALSILDDEEPAPLELYTRVNEQHEACFVYVFGNRGFYAEVSTVVRAMIYCWAHGFRLLLDSSASAWAHEQGWSDYFEPFCAESSEVAADRIAGHCDFERPEDRPVWRRLIRFAPRELDFGRENIRGFENIMAFFTNLVFRPTPGCQAVVDRLVGSLDLPDDYDAIHIRRGDKVNDEDDSYPATAYLDRLSPMRSGQTLFVMSDDRAAVEEVGDCLRERGESVHVVSLVEPGRAGFDVNRLREGQSFLGEDAGPADESGQREYVRDTTRMLIAETLIAAKSRRFVSTWRSNVGRMVAYLHRDRARCELLRPERPAPAQQSSGDGAAGGTPVRQGKAAAELAWQGAVQLRDGTVHEFELPADSPYLDALRQRVVSRSGGGGFFQLPLKRGRAALTFSGVDVRFASLVPPAEDGRPHHPLTHVDEGHLGGYLRSHHPLADRFGAQHGDPATYAPELWQWVLENLDVKSVLDVGCGEGHAAAYFQDRGCTVLGVDGSVQAERDTVIPGRHRRHDYTHGPLVLPGEWDLVWSCEFVEHVEERYTHHFLATFACARKYVLMTFAPPGQAGWHHVNCQPQDYWVEKMRRLGFDFDEALSRQARDVAGAGHFKRHGLVFVRADPGRSVTACGEAAALTGEEDDGARGFPTELPVNPMPIAHEGGHDFLLFLDIFVHPDRDRIVAVLPFYGEDWNPDDAGIDFERVFLVYRGRRIRGRYLPHRLDSWEPCALLDFEDPLLKKWLRRSQSIRFTVEAGPHTRKFCLDTAPPPAGKVLMSLVIKNENRWLRHFLEYYLNCLGADHVLVYDNGTTDQAGLKRLLRPYQGLGRITLIPWNFRWRNLGAPRKMIGQPQQEAHSLNRFAHSRWIGFLDADELLRLPDTSLPDFLAPFEDADVDGLSFGLRWYQYGGVLDFDEVVDPPLTFRMAFRSRLGRKRQKLFVRPDRVRFLRLHTLEEGGRELPIDDTDYYFHHYCQAEHRFRKKTAPDIQADDTMLRFADRLALDAPLTRCPERPAGAEEWIRHITGAIALAECGRSKLSPELLGLKGMSGAMNRHFYNNLARFRGCRYLEIGCHHGSSTFAALWGNDLDLTCIDNFSQFNADRRVFEEHLGRYRGDCQVRLIAEDCFELDASRLGPFDIYLYDGAHGREDQRRAIVQFAPCLAPLAVVLVDDWNREEVRAGTESGLAELGLEVIYRKEIFAPGRGDEHGEPVFDAAGWWNGLAVLLIDQRT